MPNICGSGKGCPRVRAKKKKVVKFRIKWAYPLKANSLHVTQAGLFRTLETEEKD